MSLDPTQVAKAKRAILDGLRANRRAGGTIGIPNHEGACDCGCRFFVAAAFKLMSEYPHKYVLQEWRDELQFAERRFYALSMDAGAHQALSALDRTPDDEEDLLG